MAEPVVYYSFRQPPHPKAQVYQTQLVYSLESLRRVNRSVPVYFHYVDALDKPFAELIRQRFGVKLINFGPYQTLIDRALPGAGARLADYPLLHKYLTLRHFSLLKPSQVLYVDSDTLFCADPLQLLQVCQTADLYARAEPFSDPAAPHPDPGYFDHAGLAQLRHKLGSRPLSPFNTGVMILNHGIWERFLTQAAVFVELALAFAPGAKPTGRPNLALPVANRWTLDQVCFWLSLGRLEPCSLSLLDSSQVLLGGETQPNPDTLPTIVHYFSTNMRAFFRLLPQV